VLTRLLFCNLPGVRVERGWRDGATIHLEGSGRRRAGRCPLCRRRSTRVQSRYVRTPADLPCGGARVVLHLRVRRFVCRRRRCPRRVFSEQLPALVAPRARRTARLTAQLLRTGFALGGEPGARYLAPAGVLVSARTLLRLVRAAPLPVPRPVRVLGVDDWARRRGRSYGTILVDLETHAVVDLLEGREAAPLAAWLRGHPEVEVVSRDRATAYAAGIREGAPQAVQVADRFHLLKNVTDALEHVLTRRHAAVRQAAQADGPPARAPAAGPGAGPPPAARASPALRARRLARYQEVVALRARGWSAPAIAAQTGVSCGTIWRWLRAGGFPERRRRTEGPSQLAPFGPYLEQRWAEGCRSATRLWQELGRRGFAGSYTSVAGYVRPWRDPPSRRRRARGTLPLPSPPPPGAWTPRRVCWLLRCPPDDLTDRERVYLSRLYRLCPQIACAEVLVDAFATVLRERDVPGLYAWLQRAEASGIPELVGVAQSLWLDREAVEAAVRLAWSNGQVEGQVNRLKTVKRAMYGRASFALLRQRLLHAA
jgi:transposase